MCIPRRVRTCGDIQVVVIGVQRLIYKRYEIQWEARVQED